MRCALMRTPLSIRAIRRLQHEEPKISGRGIDVADDSRRFVSIQADETWRVRLLRTFQGDHGNFEAPILADHPGLQRVPERPADQHSMHVVHRVYRALVERDDEVSFAQTGDRGRSAGFDRDDLHGV